MLRLSGIIFGNRYSRWPPDTRLDLIWTETLVNKSGIDLFSWQGTTTFDRLPTFVAIKEATAQHGVICQQVDHALIQLLIAPCQDCGARDGPSLRSACASKFS